MSEELFDTDTLAGEMRSLKHAADGTKVDGYIVKPPEESGDIIKVYVETPIDTFAETFEKPKPPVTEYRFSRLCDEYGHGLTDIESLDGAKVICQYDNDSAEWSVVVPKKSYVDRIRNFSVRNKYEQFSVSDIEDHENAGLSFYILLGFIIFPLAMLYTPFEKETPDHINVIFNTTWTLTIYALIIGGILFLL